MKTDHNLTFSQIIEKLRDGKSYRFGHDNLTGYFYKAPYPAQDIHSNRDGAHSAITFWIAGKRASPTLMLYDFDDDEPCWFITESASPVLA